MECDILRFENWFTEYYYQIKDKLTRYMALNEDAFHDAYLAIRIRLLFESANIIDFEAYFIKCYKRVYMKELRSERRYYHPEDIFFLMLSGDDIENVENLSELERLASDILKFVKGAFPENDYKLFVLKNFKTDCSYKDLSDYTGFSTATIYRKVNSINNILRDNLYFVMRNQQLIINN